MKLEFTARNQLSEYEWETTESFKNRIPLDRELIQELSERSNLHGLLRMVFYVGALVLTVWAAVVVSHYSVWLAIPVLYAYWFLYGFWVAVAHEMQHKMVFARSWDKFGEFLYFFVQVIIWNSPRYARISHQLHHRYTMVRGIDPETDWPEVFTTAWVRKCLRNFILNILIVGIPFSLFQVVKIQIDRIAGKKDRMMRDHCSDKDCHRIRIESAGILLFHLAVVAGAVAARSWWPVLLFTIAWQVGGSIESLWHATEHIGRAYDMNDQRLVTRSVRVNPFIRLLYGGLDDHVDHHLYPTIPSRNLPKLHKLLHAELAAPRSMISCWKEMFAIAREKDVRPENEYVPANMS